MLGIYARLCLCYCLLTRGPKGAHVDYLSRNAVECMLIDITDREWIKVTQMQYPDLEVVRTISETGDIEPK